MLDFLKVSKNCKAEASKGCFFNGTYLTKTGNDSNIETSTSMYKIITADGMSMSFLISNTTFSSQGTDKCPGPYCQMGGTINVDIDGPNKGSHSLGKDLFGFVIDKYYGILPEGAYDHGSCNPGMCLGNFACCTAWVIEHGNLDYLKVDSSGKCPNGTTLSWNNPTCK